MGKKNNKFVAPQRTSGAAVAGQAAAPAPSAVISRLLATVAQTAPLIGEEPPDWDESLVKDLAQHLPQSEQQRFVGVIDRFASWGTQLKEACERAEATRLKIEADGEKKQLDLDDARGHLDELRRKVEQQLADSKMEREEIEATRRTQEDKGIEQEAQRHSLVKREVELVQREAELRGGLVAEREQSLAVLRQQVAELEARRDRLPAEIDVQRCQLLEQARADAEQIQVRARARHQQLQQIEMDLLERREKQEQCERQQQLDAQLLLERRKTLESDIRAESQRDVDDMRAKLQRSQEKAGKLHDKIDSLQQELDELMDLRELSRGNPQRLVEEIETLHLTNRELDRRVQDLLASRSQEDGDRLRRERDDLQERLDSAEAELYDLRRRESQWKRSVTEREDWEATRQVMESNRTLLQKAVVQLQGDVKELVDRQQHESVFPELTRMDRDFNKPVVTEPVPESLGQFVDELQVRIAYSEPRKVLHFRKEELQLFLGGLAMSQLHIFQGISGTGKTTLAVAFADAVGGKLTRVPVQAGWRDRADVLGHYNAFEKRYYERETLQALYQAQTAAYRDLMHIVLLDEMNLSRPEQYFADFLSTMEMGQDKRWIRLLETAPAQAPAMLREGRDILLPSNLWFIGTANQDETTNAFADKTHDRAFVLDLPKQEEHGERLPRPRNPSPWSVDSLTNSFDAACKKHAQHVGKLVKRVNSSGLTSLLSERFALGWGNRLERQMLRFVPVVMEAGGSDDLALDHLLASRMFREGKVTGRYDVKPEDLLQVQDALLKLWKDCGLEKEPTRCLQAIQRDVQRLERRG